MANTGVTNKQTDNYERQQFLEDANKVNEDEAHRIHQENFVHKFLHTIGVCSCFFALGWRLALIGPTLPDLRMITGSTLSTISLIFTAKSIGGLIGSIGGGFAYDRLNKIGVFTTTITLLGVFAGVVPWCTHLAAMLFAHGMLGVVNAVMNTAASADIAAIWKQKDGPFIQALHASFSIGAIISPLVCESFLAKKIINEDFNATLSNIPTNAVQFLSNTTAIIKSVNSSDFAEYVYVESTNNSNVAETTNTSNVVDFVFSGIANSSDVAEYVYSETKIYIPYLICMCVGLAVGLYFIISLLTLGDVYKYIRTHKDPEDEDLSDRFFLSHPMKKVFTVLLAMSMTLYSVCEYSVTGFLVTFLITDISWTKTMGSNAMSIFWVAFAIGRLTGILAVKWIRVSAVLIMFFSVCIFGILLFWAAVVFEISTLVWISIAIIGYGLSVIMPSLYTWFSDNVRKLTGKISSILLLFISVGNTMIPFLVGTLMDKISQRSLIYAILILLTVNLSLFIFSLSLFTVLKNKHMKQSGCHFIICNVKQETK